jgi:hypothetical protein
LARAVPELHKQFEITRHGVRTFGWVTGKGGENSGIVYYAYRTNAQTYGGQYKLSSLDSDFELTHSGDAVNVIYLSTKPYISQVGDAAVQSKNQSGVLYLWFKFSFYRVFGFRSCCAKERDSGCQS